MLTFYIFFYYFYQVFTLEEVFNLGGSDGPEYSVRGTHKSHQWELSFISRPGDRPS